MGVSNKTMAYTEVANILKYLEKNEEKLLAIYDVNKIFEKKKENVTEKKKKTQWFKLKKTYLQR